MSPKWTIDNKFSVSSHIQGRKVTITVFESKKSIEVSGPGHKLWKDIAFKRIASILFSRFLQNCGIELQGSISNSVTSMSIPPQMASSPVISRPVPASTPFVPTPEPVDASQGLNETQITIPSLMFRSQMMPRPGQASAPVVPTPDPESINQGPTDCQISLIPEAVDYHSRMIRRLQNQLANITSELVKLQEKTDPEKSNPAETTAANVLHKTISVSSINSSSSEQTSSTPHKSQEPANDKQSGSKSTPQ